jgi:outer membrane protein TolC
MIRWNARLAAVAVLAAGLFGCGRQCYMTEADFQNCTLGQNSLSVPPNLENDPHQSIIPAMGNTPKPMDVTDMNRPARMLSLSEAIATSLEHGEVGSQSPLFPGVVNDTLVAFNGRTVAGSDSIRVLAMDPAIVGADIESALARFDARWISSATWTKTDQAIANGLASFQNGDSASVSSSLIKPLPTGGTVGITTSMDYTFLSTPPVFNNTATVNPSYRPRVEFLFEQPLLQFFGVEINQLSTAQPGSLLVPGLRPSGGTRTEGILITRLRFDQQRAEFERNVNYQLLNVEYAYWNLYGAYYTLFSREQGLRYALVSWQVNETRFRAGRISIQDLEQTRAQYELFRAQRITALGRVLDAERQLRGLMGLPIEDGYRLVPSDHPTLSPFKPDWASAENEALSLRPEMILARQDVKFRQLDMIIQKNGLKPDLRFIATYDINGLGTRLDGAPTRFAGFGTDPNTGLPIGLTEPGNALGSLTDNKFNSWQMGFRLDVPIGFRDAHAAVKSARLSLYRSYYQLKDTEYKAKSFLTLQFRNVSQYYEELQAQTAQRKANATQLRARFEAFQAGTAQGTIDVLLEAQRNWADSLASEYTALVNYNNALAGFQFAKGTILGYDNVAIAEGPLPQCVQVRAVEHIREREKALVAREREDPGVYEAQIRGNCPTPDAPASLVNVPLIQTAPPSGDPTTPPAALPSAPPGGYQSLPPTPPATTPPTPPAPAPGTVPLTQAPPPAGTISAAPLIPLHKDP